MNKMTRRYFAMSKEDSRILLDAFLKASEPRKAAYAELAAKYGADELLVRQCNFGGEFVIGLLFRSEPSESRGHKIEPTEIKGERMWKVSPNRRFKEGKSLDADIDKANRIKAAGMFSPWAIDELCANNEAFTDGAMHHSVAGSAKGRVVVSIPAPESESFPEIDSRLAEIKKSEFIALTEE